METKKYIGELWVNIRGYDGLYQVSNFGRVRSLDRIVYRRKCGLYHVKGRILKSTNNQYGYPTLDLCKDGKIKSMLVHKLVAIAFIPNPKHLPQVNHKDEDKTNNRLSNLEWCDAAYNSRYGTRPERLSNKMKNHESSSLPVIAFTTSGVFYGCFESSMEAERQTSIYHSNITRCCSGKYKTAGGFIWKYGKQHRNGL